MKKIIFKLWIANLLLSIVLFITYRFVIAQTNSADTNWFETILSILDIVLNIGFSFIYLAVMVLGSLMFFLNLMQNVRKNFFLSLLTFVAIPSLCAIYLLVNVLIDIHSYNDSILMTFAGFSVVYLLSTIVEFLIFRNKTKNLQVNQ